MTSRTRLLRTLGALTSLVGAAGLVYALVLLARGDLPGGLSMLAASAFCLFVGYVGLFGKPVTRAGGKAD